MPETDPTDASVAESYPTGDQPSAPPPRFTMRDVFIGADGLRAGWSVILAYFIFQSLLLGTSFTVNTLSNPHHDHPAVALRTPSQPQPGMSPVHVLSNEGIPLVSVLVATWIMGRIERRPTTVYGFLPQRGMRNFFSGLAWGLALLSLLVALLRTAGLLVFDARLLFGSSILHFAAIWIGNFLLVGLLEELLSRGYLQFTLTRGLGGLYRWLFDTPHANALGFWSAALILSFLFGFNHRTNPGESPLGLLSAGLAGFLFCFSLWRTGSLWWAIGFHTSWDWAQSFLYGVADSGLMVRGHLFATHPVGRPYLSGGLTGPEGSLLLLPVMAIGVAVILFTLPPTNAGYQPASAPQPAAALDLP